MTNSFLTPDYVSWLKELKSKIRRAQVKASLAASSVLIDFYFELGKSILEKDIVWGSKFLEQLSRDLKIEFPDMQGFSVTNLKYCRLFYGYISIRPQIGDETDKTISPRSGDELKMGINSPLYQTIRQLPWGHIKLLVNKIKGTEEILFYTIQTIENGWSRDVMALQIKSNLYARQGKSVTNFKNTLPAPQSDLAQQTIKDPYTFDFLTMTQPYNERDIENQLIEHITKFLMELGKGFAFVGRPAITKHLKNIFESGELLEKVVSSILEHTTQHGAIEGKTQTKLVKYYNLDAIITVGYRVNSKRATQFRIWATNILKEYIIKGFAMDDERLKQADRWDYFDEWLERIRDIRASEKRFYQKIRDIYATAIDYDKNSEQAQDFFKKVQNKMLWAVTGKTATELLKSRVILLLPIWASPHGMVLLSESRMSG